MNAASVSESLDSIYSDLMQVSSSLAALGALLGGADEKLVAAWPGLAHLLENASKEIDGLGSRLVGVLQKLPAEQGAKS